MNEPNASQHEHARRRGIRRTAWAVALLAAGIYVAFMLSAVLP